MRSTWVRIVVWLGMMAVFTLIAMGLWAVISGGSQSTGSLKWLQLAQTAATFVLPAIAGAWWWSDDHRPWAWLGLNRGTSWRVAMIAIAVMVCAIPCINLMADLNSRVKLPESLGSIEQILRSQEEAAAALTERFLQADNVVTLLVNIALLALLPAIAEELSFRGTLQQLIAKGERRKAHAAVWVTAVIFSAVHMQFYGFVPRMLMGATFGYVFLWTGSLWIPILMHFTNNGIAVVSYYLFDETGSDTTWADTIGTGPMWWLGVASIAVVAVLLYVLKSVAETDKPTPLP